VLDNFIKINHHILYIVRSKICTVYFLKYTLKEYIHKLSTIFKQYKITL